MKKYIRIFTITALSLIAFSACMKEDITGTENSEVVSFSVDMSKYWNNNGSDSQTKSGGDISLFSADGDSLNLSLTVSDDFSLVESVSDQISETKGVQITGSNLNAFKIGLNAFFAGSSTKYIDDQLTRDGTAHSYDPDGAGTTWSGSGHWNPVDNKKYYWPKTENLDFWAWAPYEKISAARTRSAENKVLISEFRFDHDNQTLSFDYDLGVNTAAADMPDLLFSNNINCSQKTSSTGKGDGATCVPLEFKHALAAVKFKISADFPGTVTSIEIGGAVKSASCKYPSSTGGFTWTSPASLATGKTFKQTFTDTEGAISTAKTPTIPYHNESVGGNNENSAIFMMIPQDLASGKQYVTITFKYPNKNPETYTGYLYGSNVQKWEEGHVYIYTVTLPKVGVTVEDEVENFVKKNVVIKNTGNVNAFLRATIVANWVNDNGVIIAPWDSASGTFDSLCPTGWKKSGDYYYFESAVAPNTATSSKLFNTYTAPATAPVEGTHLVMNVIVQAITATGYSGTGAYKTAWNKAAGVTF